MNLRRPINAGNCGDPDSMQTVNQLIGILRQKRLTKGNMHRDTKNLRVSELMALSLAARGSAVQP